MSKEAMKLALEALNATESDCGSRAWEREQEAITALREALTEQPAQQEPVALREALASALTSVYVCGRVWSAWSVGTMSEDDFIPASECDEVLDELVSAVTTAAPQPAQRKPLTDKEIWQLVDGTNGSVTAFARAIEAKLKEKNT